MAKNYGYINPLLSNLAEDYSRKAREGLIGQILYPRVTVGKPTGEYAVYDKASAYKVPDVTMAGERSQAHEFNTTGEKKSYAATPYALKSFINKDDLEFMEGPFKLWEKQKTEMIVSKLELAQEKRVADTVLSLAGRTTTLTGTGDAADNKWSGGGGNPFDAIKTAFGQLFYRPNLMVLTEAVYDALEFHPKLLEKLGEANMIKKVSEETLAKLFRIDRVMIAKGRADFGKEKAGRSATPTGIWGNCVVLAYTSGVWDEPCAGKTLCVKYAEADNQGYVVRTWDEDDGGVLGGQYVQVAHNVCELTVAPDLQYAIKDVL
jgi:hypothetical protein